MKSGVRLSLVVSLVLLAVSVSMTGVWVVSYVMAMRAATLTVISAPAGAVTPTPSPPVHELDWFQIGAGLSWLLTFAAGVTTVVMMLLNLWRPRTEEKR